MQHLIFSMPLVMCKGGRERTFQPCRQPRTLHRISECPGVHHRTMRCPHFNAVMWVKSACRTSCEFTLRLWGLEGTWEADAYSTKFAQSCGRYFKIYGTAPRMATDSAAADDVIVPSLNWHCLIFSVEPPILLWEAPRN